MWRAQLLGGNCYRGSWKKYGKTYGKNMEKYGKTMEKLWKNMEKHMGLSENG